MTNKDTKFKGRCIVDFGDFAALPASDDEARAFCVQVIGAGVWNQVLGVRQVMAKGQPALQRTAPDPELQTRFIDINIDINF